MFHTHVKFSFKKKKTEPAPEPERTKPESTFIDKLLAAPPVQTRKSSANSNSDGSGNMYINVHYVHECFTYTTLSALIWAALMWAALSSNKVYWGRLPIIRAAHNLDRPNKGRPNKGR